MTNPDITSDLRRLMQEHPQLCDYGIVALGFLDAVSFAKSRADLIASAELVGRVLHLLESAPRTITPTIGSYGLKHTVERFLRTYVSNGALISAALLLQIPVKPMPPNAQLGIGRRWLRLLKSGGMTIPGFAHDQKGSCDDQE